MGTEISKLFGLVGRDIDYSFSRSYFAEKFKTQNLEHCSYVNFDIQSISELPSILKKHPNLVGFNVTIPYKQEIFPYLDEIDPVAKEIGAVNTVKLGEDGTLTGFNTDAYGFENSLKPLLVDHEKAIILGTGGASKAIEYVLRKLTIDYHFISRNPKSPKELGYNDLNEAFIKNTHLIINSTPLGTFPDIDRCPNIPYEYLTSNHLLYDLIYNPSETTFMRKGRLKNTKTKNGLQMLELQADRAWDIWQKQ